MRKDIIQLFEDKSVVSGSENSRFPYADSPDLKTVEGYDYYDNKRIFFT